MTRKKTTDATESSTATDPLAISGLDFEAALAELEALVERMEEGEITLEQSLSDFERGIALTRTCQQALTAAEQKVSLLVDKNGESAVVDFTPDND